MTYNITANKLTDHITACNNRMTDNVTATTLWKQVGFHSVCFGIVYPASTCSETV